MSNELTKIISKSTYFSFGITIVFVTTIAMSLMFLLISIGSPMWLTLSLFLAIMFALIHFSTAKHIITISSLELNRTIDATFKKLPLKTKTERYEWSEVKWYKEGKDKSKYSNEYEFLKIGFNNGKVWLITDSKGENKAAFTTFKTEFIQQIHKFNHHISETKENTPPNKLFHKKEENTTTKPTLIEKRPTFYDTIWAQLFTFLLGAIIAIIITFLIFNPQYIKGSILFRLFAILIPGFIYMYYRVFKKNNND